MTDERLRYHRGRVVPQIQADTVEIDGRVYGRRARRFDGVPTLEQLRDPRLDLSTLAGHPWPGSIADSRARALGAEYMATRLAQGRWPDEEELRRQTEAHRVTG